MLANRTAVYLDAHTSVMMLVCLARMSTAIPAALPECTVV